MVEQSGAGQPRCRRRGASAVLGCALAFTSAQKSGVGVPAYLRWVNRGLGRRAAAVAYVLRWSPNQVTGLSMILSVARNGCPCLGSADCGDGTRCQLLLLAGYALDSADGQLARLTGTGSAAGEYLDHVADAMRLPAFHLAVAVYLLRAFDGAWPLFIALAFAVLSSAWFFAQILADKMGVQQAKQSGDKQASTWVSFVKLPYDAGVLYLLVSLAAWPTVFLLGYSLIFVVNVVVAAGSIGRKYRVLSQRQLMARGHP